METPNLTPSTPITPTFVLSSPLDGNSIVGPALAVNQDTAAAPQNETAIAVDPNNPNRVVAAANDYVTRTWACDINGTPCSALGDGYSGTYFSNDGGLTWAGVSSDPSHLGTLIPGVTRLTGGQYDAGGDPALAFDSQGNVYYAGLGFDRTAPPNTVAVNKGTFDGSGQLTWSQPTFINQTTAPSTLNDKEWIGADWHASSPFKDRVYVSWTRFLFNAANGRYVQSPIFFAFSTDGGQTFSEPTNISGNVLYDQGSRPVVAYDGSVYVIFDGSTRLATRNSTYIVKSTDGGATFGKPVKIATLQEVIPLANTAFRVNSFPAGAAAPNGDLYVAWSSLMSNGGGLCPTRTNTGCHSATVYSKSSDGGMTWSRPMPLTDRPFKAGWGNDTGQPNLGDYNQAVAQGGELFAVWGGTELKGFADQQPSGSFSTPDWYFKRSPSVKVSVDLGSVSFVDGNGNGSIDPGEQVNLKMPLRNYATNPLHAGGVTGIVGTLSTATPGVTVSQASSSYPDLPAGLSAVNGSDYVLQITPGFIRGTHIELSLGVSSNEGTNTLLYSQATGTPSTTSMIATASFASTPASARCWIRSTRLGSAWP